MTATVITMTLEMVLKNICLNAILFMVAIVGDSLFLLQALY